MVLPTSLLVLITWHNSHSAPELRSHVRSLGIPAWLRKPSCITCWTYRFLKNSPNKNELALTPSGEFLEVVCYNSGCCVPGEPTWIVSQDVPRELYAQHFTRDPLMASLMFSVLLDIHCPNTFLLAFLFQIPSVISSVQLKGNGRQRSRLDRWGCPQTGSHGFSSELKERFLYHKLSDIIYDHVGLWWTQKVSILNT